MDFTRLEQQMKFIKEIDKIKQIIRQNYIADSSRRENDAEHSWHLAMIVIVLSEYFQNIDLLKSLKMVLLHDLIEIYAGDTFAYDEKENESKYQREKIAADKIFGLLPQDQSEEFINLWYEFEDGTSPESIFANIADRIQPLILNISSKGKMWIDKEVTMEKVVNRNSIVLNKGPKIIAEYILKLIDESKENNYFFK
jgi:putative hydrolase of HD superfamily